MTKGNLLQRIQRLLETNIDLSFLLRLEEVDIGNLKDCIEERIGILED